MPFLVFYFLYFYGDQWRDKLCNYSFLKQCLSAYVYCISISYFICQHPNTDMLRTRGSNNTTDSRISVVLAWQRIPGVSIGVITVNDN